MNLRDRIAKFNWAEPGGWIKAMSILGAGWLLYVIIAASIQPGGAPAQTSGAGGPRVEAISHRALSVGEMGDFAFAFPPRGAPLQKFEGPEGATDLAAFKGRAVLVNFWATWCAPCLEELPSLDALKAARAGEDFDVVAIAADPRGAEVARDYLERLKVAHLDLYVDQNLRLASAIGGANVLPASILFDARGNEVGRLYGAADWASPEALRLIDAAIEGRIKR